MIHSLFLFLNYFFYFIAGEEGHDKPSLLSVNPGLIIWTIIIFLLLLIVLSQIAWKPLIKALKNREDSIKNTIENAEKLNEEAKMIMEQNKKKLEEANSHSMSMINEAKNTANTIKDEIVNKANEEAKKITERANSEISHMKETALEDIKEQIVEIAIKAAEKILSENLDEKKHKKIIDDFIRNVPKN